MILEIQDRIENFTKLSDQIEDFTKFVVLEIQDSNWQFYRIGDIGDFTKFVVLEIRINVYLVSKWNTKLVILVD